MILPFQGVPKDIDEWLAAIKAEEEAVVAAPSASATVTNTSITSIINTTTATAASISRSDTNEMNYSGCPSVPLINHHQN